MRGMSPQLLDNRLTDLRRRVRQVLMTNGLSWLAAVLIGLVLAECLGDWLFHFDDPVVRLILGLSIAGSAVWVFRRYLLTPLSVQLSDVDLALRIEDRYPGFQDSLASSVQFIRAGADPRIGSPQLQQAVVATTLGRLEELDCRDVVDTRQVRHIISIAVGVIVTTLLLAGLFRSQSAIALQRLFRPFSGPAWPRQTNLQLLREDLTPLEFDADNSLSVARGDTLQVFVENAAGHLPSRVTLEHRLADHKVVSETMRPTTMNDSHGEQREIGVGQLPSVKGELEFRVAGGDDDQMPWCRLTIVPPPAVEKLQVTVTPPAYTGRPVERLPEGVGHIQGLLGSRVAISAVVNKPIRKAVLRANSQGRGKVTLAADQRHLETSFVIHEAGVRSWWFELQDAQGFEDGEPPRYEVRGIPDVEPEIAIDVPAADMQATADAVVRVRTTARDDLGLKEMRLVYKVEQVPVPDGSTADSSVPDATSPDATSPDAKAQEDRPREERPPGEPAAGAAPPLGVKARRDRIQGEQSIPLLEGDGRPLTHTAEYQWKIAELSPGHGELGSGSRILFHTEATDDFDLTPVFPAGKAPPPHVGRSVMRTITIVSREEKMQEISQRQEGLLADLERANQLEQHSHAQVDDLIVQLETADKFRPADLDTLQRTELGQREIASQLNNPVSGLAKRARELSDELRNNQINDPQAERRLNRIADELDRISGEHLEPIEQELTQARKLLQSPAAGKTAAAKTAAGKTDTAKATPEKAASETTAAGKKAGQVENLPHENAPEKNAADRPEQALHDVSENQAAVLESIGEMLHDLSQWRQEHDAAQELGDLIRQQADLNQRSAELGRRTLTKPSDQLTPQERADLGKVSERQKKQADQLEQLEAKMRSTIENLSTDDPSAAAALADAAEQSQQGGIAGQMRDAAGQIGENRMGQAARSQQEVLQKLREVEDVLRHNRESDSEMLVKKLKQAEGELQNLRDRQAEMLHKMQAAAEMSDPQQGQSELERLRQEQQQLQAETARLARRLARLEARRASTSADRAAARMQKSQSQIDEGDSSAAAEQQQEALDDLEQAQRELASRRRDEEETLAREQLARIADELAGLVPRQQAALDETKRLDDLHQTNGKWLRAQLGSLRDLTPVQRDLAEETGRIAEKLAAAEVFALALQGALVPMRLASDRIAERETGVETQQAQAAARQRLADLVDALKPEPPGPPEGEPPAEQAGGGSGEQGPQSDGIPNLAQVKLLILLQKELSARTAKVEQQRGKDGRLPRSAQEQLESIAREQGQLADLVRNLSSSAPDDDEEPDESDGDTKPSATKEAPE